MFSNSIQALEVASRLRAQGTLPSSLALWCVDNPLVQSDASRLEVKADAGAQVVLTQPPLLWDSFMRWADDVQRYVLFVLYWFFCTVFRILFFHVRVCTADE